MMWPNGTRVVATGIPNVKDQTAQSDRNCWRASHVLIKMPLSIYGGI
jgi:hypothetical protein